MSDEITQDQPVDQPAEQIAPEAPVASAAAAAEAPDHEALCNTIFDHIEKWGGEAAARLHQLLDEMHAIFTR
jgi:hypothetical protein